MDLQIQIGSILIEDRPSMIRALSIEIEPYARDWGLVRVLNGRDLDRKIRAAGWNFFFIAGQVQATSFGTFGPKNTQKALKRILARGSIGNFNSLEITAITAKRFLGVPYTTIAAHWRHIQLSCLMTTPSTEGRTRRMRNGREPEQRVLMGKADQYLAAIVSILFLAGIVAMVKCARERSKVLQRWSGASPRHKNKAT